MSPRVIELPTVLKGPDFQLDARVYEQGGGITGSLHRGPDKVTLRLEGDMTRLFFFRCLLGEYSGAYSRPNFERLERIANGEAVGRPLIFVPMGQKFRAEFSFDTGPSLEDFHLSYDDRTQVLSVRGEIFATCWDGDNYRPSKPRTVATTPSPQAFVSRCRELRDIRERVLELIESDNMAEAQANCRVLLEEINKLNPPPDYESYHNSIVSLSSELSLWATTGEKRDSVDRLLREVRLGEFGYLG